MNLRMFGQEGLDLFCLMRREVVGDDVNLLATRLVGRDVGEEGHELGRGVARCGLADHDREGMRRAGLRALAMRLSATIAAMQVLRRSRAAPQSSVVEVRRSGVHGWGVFARNALRAGQVIGEYTGKRYAAGEVEAVDWNDQLTYLFGLSDGSVIDGAQGGNATRHINHACDPNAEAVESDGAAGELIVTVRTLRNVRAGEEVFLDYALVIDGDDPSDYPCACGQARCRGTLAVPAGQAAS